MLCVHYALDTDKLISITLEFQFLFCYTVVYFFLLNESDWLKFNTLIKYVVYKTKQVLMWLLFPSHSYTHTRHTQKEKKIKNYQRSTIIKYKTRIMKTKAQRKVAVVTRGKPIFFCLFMFWFEFDVLLCMRIPFSFVHSFVRSFNSLTVFILNTHICVWGVYIKTKSSYANNRKITSWMNEWMKCGNWREKKSSKIIQSQWT